jgi:hypothetical protein
MTAPTAHAETPAPAAPTSRPASRWNGYRFLTRGERGSRLEALTTIAGSEG